MKNTVHNLMEAKVLIKEAYGHGDEIRYDNAKWFSHAGQFICTSHVRDIEFDLVVEDVDSLYGYRSVTCEVL